MSNTKLIKTPEGVRDILPSEYERKLGLERELLDTCKRFGFCPMETPTFEFFDLFGKEIGTTPSKDLYKFFDREGNTLVLRPDVTPQIVRIYVSVYAEKKEPFRVCYRGNTYINHSSYTLRPKEITQIGAELLGEKGVEADAQMIALASECLKASGLTEFQIGIGHAGYLAALTEEAGMTEEQKTEIEDLLNNRNYFGVTEAVKKFSMEEDLRFLFEHLGDFYSDAAEMEELNERAEAFPKVREILSYFRELDRLLAERGVQSYASYELGQLPPFDYYTGVIFDGYTYEAPEPLLKGGRYDRLLSFFGLEEGAIGFAVRLDTLLQAESRQHKEKNPVAREEKQYLTFALTKGRLAEQTLALLEKVGISCEEMKDKKTRKLIFVNEELKLKFFLAKGPDVPTYVEYGAADIGVTGRDTILEEGKNVHEVLDLGFGVCRMCVCGPESARALLDSREMIRVATKYPKIARDYFLNVRHQTAEIIKLNGSIELAPIVGLSEVIVDIVETGSTLRENGLLVLEEVKDLSARMIVNQVSMRMENERIRDIIQKLRALL